MWRPLAVATIGAATLTMTGAAVMATLRATASNVTPRAVEAGTLLLDLVDDGAGFAQSIGGLAPGDVVNRYVRLESTGSLDARALTFATAATGTPTLVDDGVGASTTRAIRVSVASCSVRWDTATGTCSGTTTSLLAPVTLGTAATPRSLGTGSLPPGGRLHLRIQVTLPDQDETTVNGVLPAQSVQGGAVEVVYTFGADQRPATTTGG